MCLDLIAVGCELVDVKVCSVESVVCCWYDGDVVLVHDTMVNNLLFYNVVEWVQNSFLEFSEQHENKHE